MRFRFIPGDTYTIGSPADEPGRYDDELQHAVRITRGFWLGETEVTQAQWGKLVPTNPSRFSTCGEDCPVEQTELVRGGGLRQRGVRRSQAPPLL